MAWQGAALRRRDPRSQLEKRCPAVKPPTLLILCGLAITSAAQLAAVHDRPAQSRTTHETSEGGVAVVDMEAAFKRNTGLEQGLASLKEEADAFSATMQAADKEIKAATERLKTLSSSSYEAEQARQEIEKMRADAGEVMKSKRAELKLRESRLYFDTYQALSRQVAAIAKENNYRLVLNSGGGEIDATQLDAVIQGVKRPVAFHAALDITDQLVERANKQ